MESKSYKDNYNVIFIDILQACSSNDLLRKLSGFKLRSPSYFYKCVLDTRQELMDLPQDSDISFLDREKQDELIRKFFGKEFNWPRQTGYVVFSTSVHP